jgi:hypothetical protein
MGALFAEGSISIGAEQTTTRPQTAPVFGSTIPARIRPPPTPPTEGGRRLRLWSSFGLSDLHVAVISGKEGDVREALRSNIADINEVWGEGSLPLWRCCSGLAHPRLSPSRADSWKVTNSHIRTHHQTHKHTRRTRID